MCAQFLLLKFGMILFLVEAKCSLNTAYQLVYNQSLHIRRFSRTSLNFGITNTATCWLLTALLTDILCNTYCNLLNGREKQSKIKQARRFMMPSNDLAIVVLTTRHGFVTV